MANEKIMAKFPTYEEMGKKVAEKALDEFLYDGKSIREWMQIIASEDAISKQVVLDVLAKYDNDMKFDVYSEIFDNIDKLPPVSSLKNPNKSECEHDHEILKAYSDGASAVLDEIRAEIAKEAKCTMNDNRAGGLYKALQIINKYAEGSDK